MDLSVNSSTTSYQDTVSRRPDTTENEERNAADIFLPDEVPLNCSMRGYGNYRPEIKNLQSHTERHKEFFKAFLPFIEHLKLKYAKSAAENKSTPTNNESLDSNHLDIDPQNTDHKPQNIEPTEPAQPLLEVPPKTLPGLVSQRVYPQMLTGGQIIIGGKGTIVSYANYSKICWASPATATRSLLDVLFPQEVLATHTLTGKPSPAFYGRERPPKNRLNDDVVADIIECVLSTVPGATVRGIRSAITTKCADASKKKKYNDKKEEEVTGRDEAVTTTAGYDANLHQI